MRAEAQELELSALYPINDNEPQDDVLAFDVGGLDEFQMRAEMNAVRDGIKRKQLREAHRCW